MTLDQHARDLLVRCEFGDLLLLTYFVVLTRQWLWGLSNSAAWGLTVPIALLFWIIYVSRKDPVERRPGFPFWLLVGVPLLLAFALRAPFPDTSFDVWSLRLFHGDRGLQGFIYLPGEFFPTAAPFNPTPDMVTGIFRYLLGYRLGTVVNLLALLWAGTILDRLLRPIIVSPWLRAPAVLLCLWAEHLLFEVNNYMPDLLALPLMLEATRLTLTGAKVPVQRGRVVRVALLIGLAVAFKLSNGATAAPLVLIWIWRFFREPFNPGKLATTTLACLAVFIAPLLPFSVWLYRLTGSPTFPIYNGFFRSPFYPPFNGWDDRWGGYGALEILSWPILMFLNPERTSELPVYSGRLTVAFVVALVCMVTWRRLDSHLRLYALIIVVGTFLWSLTMGYIRYGLYLEVLSGLFLISVVVRLGFVPTLRWRHLLSAGILILVIVQSIFAASYLLRYEWSMRPTAFEQLDSFREETRYVFRDRSTRAWLTESVREKADNVDVWVVSGAKTPALMWQLNDRPLFIGARYRGLLLTEPSREWLKRSLEDVHGAELWSLALPSDYGEALFALRNVGLGIGRIESMVIPFYAPISKVHVYFFEVVPHGPTQHSPVKSEGTSGLPPEGYRARLELINSRTSLKPGETQTFFFRVENQSSVPWPSLGQAGDQYRVVLSGRWLSSSREKAVESWQAFLPYDLTPGESTVFALTLSAPLQPGDHTLEVDLIQEGVTRFSERDSNALHLAVRVEP